jgi:hypothetical protein
MNYPAKRTKTHTYTQTHYTGQNNANRKNIEKREGRLSRSLIKIELVVSLITV